MNPGPVRHRRKFRRAFTLIEVMMAATILVIGFGAMIQSVTIGAALHAAARRQNLATQILTHEIEVLRLQSWSTISGLSSFSSAISLPTSGTPAMPSGWPADPQYPFAAAINASGATYTLSAAVTSLATDPVNSNNKLIQVTVTVTWTARFSGANAPFTYTRINTAYFSRYGLNLSFQRS
ncbi:MAG: prepilin-type N-terminal cleavage/methylation domain-containing protein [Opitutales bacterium]